MNNSIRYIKTLIELTELEYKSKSYNAFCSLGTLQNRKIQLPCNKQSIHITGAIQCINCIYNKEDLAPKQTREFLKNIIQTSEET